MACEFVDVIRTLPRKDERVFCEDDGHGIRSLRTAFEQAVKNAGIEDFTFHDLRHTFASHVVMGGVDLLTVKELLGHKSITMTLQYSHLSPDHKRKIVQSLRFVDGNNTEYQEM
jgi:site-specific recombinase XerD